MVAILASKYLQKTVEVMMYLCTIIKVHWSFVGDEWITYDSAYHRKAAATKSLDWSQVDLTLYNETFTSRIKSVIRCFHCLSDLHSSQECPYIPGGSHSLTGMLGVVDMTIDILGHKVAKAVLQRKM